MVLIVLLRHLVFIETFIQRAKVRSSDTSDLHTVSLIIKLLCLLTYFLHIFLTYAYIFLTYSFIQYGSIEYKTILFPILVLQGCKLTLTRTPEAGKFHRRRVRHLEISAHPASRVMPHKHVLALITRMHTMCYTWCLFTL